EALIDGFARTYLQSGLAAWGVYRWSFHAVLRAVSDQQGLARRAPNADERQLQFSGGGPALRSLAVPDPLFVGGSAAKDTGADREGQTNRGARRSESAATGPIDRGVRSRGLQRGVVPLPGWQGSGSGQAAGAVRQLGQIFR